NTPPMKLGYTIIYVPDVEATLLFYENAFGLKRKFVHESNQYGELDTGATVLAFCSEILSESNGVQWVSNRPDALPAGIEIALVTKHVHEAYAQALANNAMSVSEPTTRPWGQEVGYVRDLNGVLVELCSPIG
ncbi:MAG TPA: VOC family protein, partial [Opitutales bacterium]|nr:VOC family protein [Opitutales bacterium]